MNFNFNLLLILKIHLLKLSLLYTNLNKKFIYLLFYYLYL